MAIVSGQKDHDEAAVVVRPGPPTLFARPRCWDRRQTGAAGRRGRGVRVGPLLSGGYWNLPEETAKTYRDGWLRTGDMAREDEDGFWFIVDRVKDVIVTGGFNVYPREGGRRRAEHPSVAQGVWWAHPTRSEGETADGGRGAAFGCRRRCGVGAPG